MVCGELSAWEDGNTQQVELHRVASWDARCLLRCSQLPAPSELEVFDSGPGILVHPGLYLETENE